MRNQLQHAEATFTYRHTRALLRRVMAFLDRFTLDELNCWIGDAVNPEAWGQLLGLTGIQQNAERLAGARAAQLGGNADYVVTECPNCGRQTLVRARLGGSKCMYCRHAPTLSGTPQPV